MKTRVIASVVLNISAIIVCGVIGGVAGFGTVYGLGLDGIPGAVLATLLAMIVAALAWAVGAAAVRRLRFGR
jgi:hypothetical protein